MAENTDKLYDLLKSDGYTDLGSKEEFGNFVKHNAAALHAKLKADGYTDLGTADEFTQFFVPTTENPDAIFAPTAEGPNAKPRRTWFENMAASEAVAPITPQAMQSYSEQRADNPEARLDDATKMANYKYRQGLERAENMPEGAPYSKVAPRVDVARKAVDISALINDTYGGWAKTTPTSTKEDIAASDRDWQEREQLYNEMDEAEDKASIGLSSKLGELQFQQQAKELYNYLNDRLEELEASQDAHAKERAQEAFAKVGENALSTKRNVQRRSRYDNLGTIGVEADEDQLKEGDVASTALRVSEIAQLRRRLNLPTRKGEGDAGTWVQQLAQGFGAGFDWSDLLTLGWGDLIPATEENKVLQKVEDGEALSDYEQEILDLVQLKKDVEGYLQAMGGVKTAASVGSGVGQMVPYMAGFAPGAGAAKGLTAPLIKKVVKDGGKKWVGNLVTAGISAVPATALTPTAYLDYQERTKEQYFDESGRLHYDEEGNLHKWQPTSNFKRLYQSAVSGYLENFSEMGIGELIEGPIKAVSRKIGSHIGLSKLYKMVDENKFMRHVANSVNWNGSLGEFTEELFVNLTQPLFTGELGQLRENFSAPNLWETYLVCAVVGGSMNTTSLAGTALKEGTYRMGLAMQEKQWLKAIETPYIRKAVHDAMHRSSIADISNDLSQINWQEATEEDMRHAMTYIQARTNRLMYNAAGEGEKMAQEFSDRNSQIENFIYATTIEYDSEGKPTAKQTEHLDGVIVTAQLGNGTYAIKSGDYASGNPTSMVVLVDKHGNPKQVSLGQLSNIQEFSAAEYLQKSYAGVMQESAPIMATEEVKEDAEISESAGIVPIETVAEAVEDNASPVSVATQNNRPKNSYEIGEEIETSDGRRASIYGVDTFGKRYAVRYWDDNAHTWGNELGSVSFADVAGVPQIQSFDELERQKDEILGTAKQVEAAMEATAPSQPEQTTTTEQSPATATAAIPVDAEGNQQYESVPVENTWVALVEDSEGNMADALDTAQQMLSNAQQMLDKLDKQPQGKELSVADIQRTKKEKKRLIEKVQYWSDVVAAGQSAMIPQPIGEIEETPTTATIMPEQDASPMLDPRTMSEEEKQRRGEMLRNAPAVFVEKGIIKATDDMSARKVAEKWWDENVREPQVYNTEIGDVEVNKNSIQSSLAHRYSQAKLDAITSIVEGFENAVYLGSMEDGTRQEGVINHYFAYPIQYDGTLNYVFCRAMQDANKNSLYVHEVFIAENIKKGDTLQTAAFQPHGGISLYRDILANVLSTDKGTTSIPENQTEGQEVAENVVIDDNVSPEDRTQPSVDTQIEQAEQETNPQPTEAQKEAGNYKKGHVKIDGFDITIETPKGVERSGVDANGNEWKVTMNNTYGYIRGTEGVDGDQIDVFLSDNLDNWNGEVYVVDQVNPDGSFDEHKVMYGFNSIEEAQSAYLSNYSEGWQGLGAITGTTKEEFQKWVASSHRKTKPFAEYKSVKTAEGQATETPKTKTEQVETERLSLNEYLGRLGLSSPISYYMDDKLRNPRGLTASQVAKLEKEASAAANEYQRKRSAAIAEYQRLVEQGKIIPTTRLDVLIATANGHADNEAVQAARRALEKRGYDWITGEKFQPETVHTTPTTEQANAVPKTDIQKPQLDAFEEAVANQGYVERKPNKAKFNIWEFVAGKEVRPTAKVPTVLEGVYYDNGFRVGTDGKVLVKVKDGAYPSEYEGTVRMRDGARTDEGVKFPPYEKVIPDYKQADSRKIDFVDLLGFLNAVKDRVTAEHKATNQHRSLSAALNNTPISMRLSNGEVVSFSLAKLIKFALAAKQIGADRIYGNDWTRAILAKNKNGELALLIPVDPDVYPFEGSSRYYYAPELEAKPETNKTPVKSDTQPTQESTPTVAQPATDGVVDRSTIQLVMSDAEFAELLKSGTREQLEAYRNELDKQLALDGSTVLSDGEAIRKEYKQLVEEYGGKDNVPADRFDALNARYLPYAKLKDAIYDRMYALHDRIRELDEQEVEKTKQQEKQQKAEFNDTAYNGFLKGKTPLAAAAANKALSKKYNFDGKTMTVAEYIEDAVRNNSVKLSTIEENKYKGASRSAWNKMTAAEQAADEKRVKESGTKTIYTVNDHDFGKQAYAYAQYLLDNTKPQDSAETSKAKPKPILASKEPAPTTSKDGKNAKIEDFGEKIGGARKDVVRQRIKDSMAYSRTDLVNLKDPDKILSRTNILKYVREGEMTNQDATTLLAFNMAVRSVDSRKGLWLEKYREAALAWSNGQDVVVGITEKDIDNVIEELAETIRQRPNIRQQVREGLEFTLNTYNDYKATYEALNYPEVNRAVKSAYIRYGRYDSKYWVVASASARRGWPCATMAQAVARFEREYPIIPEAEGKKNNDGKEGNEKIGSLYVTKDERGYYRIKSRNIPGSIYLSKRLYSKKEAEQFLQDNAQALVEREDKMTEALMGSNIGMVDRQGPDYRNGKDVTPQDFLDTFGFRGVEFGNWVPQAERQLYLNKAYDAIMDLCEVVGISPKAFSLGGRLALAFGARGKSKALAHYEPLKEVINLTRLKGAGSLAHEWFHALDNYLSRQVDGNVSGMTTSDFHAQRSEVAQKFRDLVYKMNGLAYSRRSSLAGPYWNGVWERAARLFENYVYNKLAESGIVSPLLVRKDTLFEETDPLINEPVQSAWPYPSAEENELMKPYFDTLFDTIQEREEDGKAVLYQIEDGDLNTAEAKMSTEEVINLVKATGVEVEIATPEMIAAEEKEIIAKAKANGTYLKAPNGKPTNLTPRQWAQVRTKAFKKWFGDWEKAARIEKLRNSPSIIANGDEYIGKYELNNKSAAEYINSELRGSYTNKDTNEEIKITRKGAFKVTRHDAENDVHLKSIALIPEMLQNAIFITEESNDKGNNGFESYRYYVVGVNMGSVEYTAKLVIGVKNGETYYDHSLTEIEKTNLIDRRDEISSSFTTNEDANFEYKDRRLISILQINASKVVDANGEPMVVYHGSNWKGITTFDRSQSKRRRSGLREYGHFFTTNRALAELYSAVDDAPEVKEEIARLDAQIDLAAEAKDINKMLDLYTEKERITRNLGGRVYEVFLNLRDVAEFDADYQADKGWYNLKADVGYKTAIGRDAMEAYAGQNGMTGNRLRKDGIIGRNIIDLFVGTENKEALKPYFDKYGGDVFLAFDAQNIKSATDNEGTFDTTNPDIRYLRTSEGDVYGWMTEGKIYLTEKGLNPETPIHEYTHIWDMVCRNENPELWKQGVELMKQSPLWEQVRTNPAYANIANNEDALASEVHARLVAPGGANILADMLEQQNVRPSLVARIKHWIAKFWRWLRKKEMPESKLSIVEFANMPLKDLAVGRNLAESIAKANAKQKTELLTLDNVAPILPMIGRRRKEEMYAILTKRRLDLSDSEKLAVIEELDKLDNNKLTNAAFHYFANGTIRIPEDMPKVEQAVKVAEIAKVDPMAYKSPMELINAHLDVKLKEPRIDPDTVPTLSNKVEYENGLTVYDVEESEESRQNMRRIINTHFGEDSSPWCLLQGDGKGNLTGDSERYWNHYNAQPKRVAFQNGKLLAFFASDGEPTWWDRQDDPHTGGIPVTRKLPDGSGRVGTVEFNETTGEWGEFTNIHLGQRGDKVYEEWLNEEQLSSREIRVGDKTYRYDWDGSGIFDGYLEMTADATKTLRSARWYGGVVPETVVEDNTLFDYYRGRIQRIQKLSNYGDVVEWDDNGNTTYVKDVDNAQEYSVWFGQDGTIKTIREMNPEGSASFLADYKESNGRLQRCTLVSEDGVKTFVSWNDYGLQQYRVGEEAIVMIAGDVVDATDGFSGLTSAQAEELAEKVKQEVELRVAEYVEKARAKAAEWQAKAEAVAKRYSDVRSFEQQGERQLADATTKERYRDAEDTAPVAALDQVQQMAEVAKALAEKLNIPVEVYTNKDDITDSDKLRQSRRRRSKGWWNENGSIGINVTTHASKADIEATILHEVVAHKGLREMVGDEAAYNDLLDRVWDGLTSEQQEYWGGRYSDKYEAVDEYLATFAEGNVPVGVWDRIIGWFRHLLDTKLGGNLQISDKDIAYMLWKSRTRLEKGLGAEEAIAMAQTDRKYRQAAYRSRRASDIEPGSFSEMAVVDIIRQYTARNGITDKLVPPAYRQQMLTELFQWLPQDMREHIKKVRPGNPLDYLDRILYMKQKEDNRESLRGMLGDKLYNAALISIIDHYTDKDYRNRLINHRAKQDIRRAEAEDRGNTYLDKGNKNATFEDTGRVDSNEFVRKIQDNAEPIKKFMQRLEEAFGVKIDDTNNAYNVLNRWSSRAKVQQERFQIRYIQPMLDVMLQIQKDNNMGYQDISDYCLYKHAIERHRSGIPAFPDGPQVEQTHPLWNATIAKEYVKKFEEKVSPKLVESLWTNINLSNRYILDYLVSSGNISLETKNRILGHRWKYYVPLVGWDMSTTNAIDAEEFYDFGEVEYPKGVSSTAYIGQINQGRITKPADPIANMMNFGLRAIMSAENNKMKQVLYKLCADAEAAAGKHGKHIDRVFELAKQYAVKDAMGKWRPLALGEKIDDELLELLEHSNKARATINEFKKMLKDPELSPAKKEYIFDCITRLQEEESVRVMYNAQNGMAGELPISSALDAMRTVTLYINGEKQTIKFADPLIAMAINGELVSAKSEFTRVWGRLTRTLSGLFTNWNPAFIVANMVRDFRHAFRMHILDSSYGGPRQFVRNLPYTYGALWRNAREKAKPLTVQEIGDFDILHSVEDRAELMQKYGRQRVLDTLFNVFNEQGGLTGYVFTKGVDEIEADLRKIASQHARKSKSNILRWHIDSINAFKAWYNSLAEVSEGSTRFATFLASLEKGHTADQAAQNAKDITVNFNRKGEWSQALGSVYLFFNASVQASAQEFKAAKQNPKAVAGIAAYRVISGVFMSMWSQFMLDMINGVDDDERNDLEIPLHVRLSNTIIPLWNGKYIKIPLAQGSETLFNSLGVYIYELVSGKMDWDDFAGRVLRLSFDSFSPFAMPENGDIWRTIIPSVMTPFYDIWTNKDYLGRPIHRERYSDATPEYQLGLANTPRLFVNMSRLDNYLLGGNDIERGSKNRRGEISAFRDFFETNPANLHHIVQYYLGGSIWGGKFFWNLVNLGTAAYDWATKGETDIDVLNNLPIGRRFLGEAYVPSKSGAYYDLLNRLKVQHTDYNRYISEGREVPENIKRDEFFYQFVNSIDKSVKNEREILATKDSKSKEYKELQKKQQDIMFEAIYMDEHVDWDAPDYLQQFNKAIDDYNKKYRK